MPDMPVEWISRIGALWKRWGVGVRVGGQRGRTEVGCGRASWWTEGADRGGGQRGRTEGVDRGGGQRWGVGMQGGGTKGLERELGVGVGGGCVERVCGVLPLGL